MISASVAVSAVVLILVGLLIQPSFILIIALYMGYTVWSIHQEKEPKESLEQLLVAIQEQDEATARSLVSESLQAGMDILFSSFSGEQSAQLDVLLEEADVTKCSILDKETAVCTICIRTLSDCQDLTLNKENNRWVVDFDK